MNKGIIKARTDRVGLDTPFVDQRHRSTVKNQARPICCTTDEEADHYAVFIETLLNPAAPNCSTADPLQINHNLTTQSLHGLVMPQGLQLPVMGLAFTYPNPVNSLEGSVVKMNEEVKEMESICRERRQSVVLLKQTLEVLQQNFTIMKKSSQEQSCDSVSDGLTGGHANGEMRRPDVIEIDDSGDEDNNNNKTPNLNPRNCPADSMLDDIHSNMPPLIHTDEIDKEKGHTDDVAAAHQTFLDNLTWFPFLYYPDVDSQTDNSKVSSTDDLKHPLKNQPQNANHHISVIKTSAET